MYHHFLFRLCHLSVTVKLDYFIMMNILDFVCTFCLILSTYTTFSSKHLCSP